MTKKKERDINIVCTLGPASARLEVLKEMSRFGMTIARLNFSHGSHEQQKKMIRIIRSVNKRYKSSNIKILQDLEGYRIRVGRFANTKKLTKNSVFFVSNEKIDAVNHIPIDYSGDIKTIKNGSDIFIDDGQIHLKVVGHLKSRLKAKVVIGGLLKQRKGVNIPQLKLSADILTSKDKKDLKFGIANKVDYIAQSFVRNADDILKVRRIAKKHLPDVKIIAKIESREGVENIDDIIDACDGIMIARGDLGVTLPIYKIPMIQKYIIRRCNRKKKFVITATQMLESMTDHSRPTRAEVSDVANAILDGTDYVMLSGETAVGKYPAKTVKLMSQIIDFTESYEQIRF